MSVLEKVLEEIKDLKKKQNSSNQDYATGYLSALSTVEGIISGVKENDGWIPVEEKLPPFGKRLQATILHHEWIADYDSSWVPEEEKLIIQNTQRYAKFIQWVVCGFTHARKMDTKEILHISNQQKT